MRFSSVSSCPPRSTTKARGRWPCSLSGTETTAASATLHTGMVRWRGWGWWCSPGVGEQPGLQNTRGYFIHPEGDQVGNLSRCKSQVS